MLNQKLTAKLTLFGLNGLPGSRLTLHLQPNIACQTKKILLEGSFLLNF